MISSPHFQSALGSELVLIGAPYFDLLIPEAERILRYLEKVSEPNLTDIAYTANKAAKGADMHSAIVATSPGDLREKLLVLIRRIEANKRDTVIPKGVYLPTERCPAPGRTVFLFPGEGSQYPDMMRGLALRFPACRSAFDDADTATILAGAKFPPSRWIFPTGELPAEGILESQGMGAVLQSVLAANTALLRLFAQFGVEPDAVLGSGIGEISALECAKAITYRDRNHRIDFLRQGYHLVSSFAASDKIPTTSTILVATLPRERLESILSPFGGDAVLAQERTADVFTVCVRPACQEKLLASLHDAGAFARILPVRQPFHTSWLNPVIQPLGDFFRSLITHAPGIPVYSTMTTRPFEGTPEELAELVARQWETPTNLHATIERLYEDGFRVFVELGARGTISTCVAATLRHRPHVALAANRAHRPDILQLHNTLAALATHGLDIDATPLFASRPVREIDFDHPASVRHERTVPLPTRLPSMKAMTMPEGLVKRIKLQEAAAAQAAAPATAADDGSSDFPLIADAEILRFSPEESIELTLAISPFDHPFLLSRALAGDSVSVSDKALHGLLLMPVEFLLETMAEAARKLFPRHAVVAVENLETLSWPEIPESGRALRILVRHRPRDIPGRECAEAVVFDHDARAQGDPLRLASATLVLAEEYPAAPPPATLAIRAPVPVGWQGADLYPTRLYDGPAFQTIHAIRSWGDNGLHAECVTLPRRGLLRRTDQPHFSIAPVLLSSIGSSLAAWHAREPAPGRLHIAYGCDRIEFFGPPPAEWDRTTVALFASPSRPGDLAVSANADVTDIENRLLCRATGWRNRVLAIDPRLHHLLLHPVDGFFTAELPEDAMPSLPQEVVCCVAPQNPMEEDDPDFDFRMRLTASLTLSASERVKWDELAVGPLRRTEWLYGRIAAKDAVRRCLLARYGRRWAAADIRIESGELGKPSPEGDWRLHCGAHMDISITHTTDHIVAAAAPNASLGIDIESRDRALSEEFISAAFSPLEQEIAADSGDGVTALFRFWCAKEALSKALGTGLRFGARDLCAHSLDPSSGRIRMELAQLWLQAFPHLRDKALVVDSCIVDGIVLAVSVLDPAVARPVDFVK